jgi:hypothetical protein
MKKYQGEDIEFRLIYKKGDNFTINDWNGFQEIKAILYTKGCFLIKYSSKTSSDAGFNKLTMVDSMTYSAMLQSKDTKNLETGPLSIEIKGIINNNEICISRETTGIYFENNFIKNI